AGRVLARKWRRPAIEMFPTFASGDRFLFSRAIGERFAADIDPGHPALVEYFAWLTELLSVHDLADVSVEDFLAPADESNLVFLPWEFQLANEGFDDRHTFVGPCLAGPEPDIWSPPGTDPVALVSLGTTSNHHPDFFRQCAAAFEDLPWHVVCTHGGGVEPGELGRLPRNVEVHRWLPHTAVLPYASVFVSQAGMGSVMQALHFGVPQVMVPYLPEQQFIAERAVELGLGLAVRKENISPSVLRDAVLATARDETVRAAVRDMRGHIKAAGGTARAADVVEARLRTGLAMAHMR
ncbi:MAG TPA: macrolide family glycosyltransferase, partial [Pseudonocardiaceae bacterium]|nr:macrolide family glycosyltransferase [Pseudonocardiaceae bacterium]